MKLMMFVFLALFAVILAQCNSSESTKGVICIQDSINYPGDATRNIYVYYRDWGLMGRSNTTYVAIESDGKFLSERHYFFSDPGIMQIKTQADSLYIYTSNEDPKYIESSEIKYRVIVDSHTWKYPSPKCYPVVLSLPSRSEK